MNEKNKKYLWNLILSTGDYLAGKLPEHPNHPKGRNPYAHVSIKVKNHFGKSYKDIPDKEFKNVKNYLKSIREEEG